MSPHTKNPLQKQLEERRFLNAVDYVHAAARSIKKINSSELLHLNQVLTNSAADAPLSSWRTDAVEIQLPDGAINHFNLVSNPLNRAREILGHALDMTASVDPKNAGLYVYTELVLAHLFRDANRRTAVLATIWILELAGRTVDAHQLLEIPLGNLRSTGDKAKFAAAFDLLLS
jgi:hypothetical protein